MKNPERYLHEWELDERSLLIRFYLFWYQVGEEGSTKITFCKLFWAVVCAPLMGLAWAGIGILAGIIYPFVIIHDHWEGREKPANTPGPSLAKRGAVKIPRFFSWLADTLGDFLDAHRWIGKTTRNGFLYGAIVGVLGGGTYGVVRLVALVHGNWSWTIFGQVWIGIGSFVVLMALVTGVGYALAKTGVGSWIGQTLWAGLCAVGRFFRAIWRFLAAGFYATKYRTCPRVVIK